MGTSGRLPSGWWAAAVAVAVLAVTAAVVAHGLFQPAPSREETCPVLEYDCNRANLPPELADRFAPLSPDAETDAFLAWCADASWRAVLRRAVAHRLKQLLRRLMPLPDALGLLGIGDMHVFTTRHTRELLGGPGGLTGEEARPLTALLDVGAGSGAVTEKFLAVARHVMATEASRPLVRRLRQRGRFAAVLEMAHLNVTEMLRAAAEAHVPLRDGRYFDAVVISNVLDRCDQPLALLRAAAQLVHPTDGRLLLAVVLPFRPVVQDALGRRRAPQETLATSRVRGWEASAAAFHEEVLQREGLVLERLAKLPYLSEAHTERGYAVLYDAVFLARRSA